ncbi:MULTISPECIES: hypothetical protein [Mesorhizobium]|uniref:hypothetical protein n=1 Tax=Mesorhizobium TaxID=68287 RepID=UPI0012BCE3E7|nr:MULTISPECIES: hypothetical protein [Mesorhizobium]
MKSDLSSYDVTELTPEEASAISGGFWQLIWAAVTLIAFVAASVGEAIVRQKH